jgi:MSHA biogenesis protein MshQ
VNNGIHLSDSSTYAAVDSFNEISKGSPPVISTGSAVYDGVIEVQIPNTRFKYNKIRTDNTTFNIKSPFTASIDMVFSSAFLTDEDGVCFQTDYANSNCLSFTIPNITGANMRYGRVALASTYGPETESLNVPVKVEYVDTNNQWLINSEDNCTNINFLETSGDIILESIGSVDITEDIIDISSNGLLFEGVSNDSANFLLINSENKIGEVRLRLSPTASGVVWPTYLNYDWDGDGSIDTNDFPEANVTFGQFRGNDKIIQWREVFN